MQMHRGAAEEAEGAYQALLDLERRSQGRVVSAAPSLQCNCSVKAPTSIGAVLHRRITADLFLHLTPRCLVLLQMSRPVSAVTRVLAPLLLQEWRVRGW